MSAAWTTGTPYVLRLARKASSFTCSVTGAGLMVLRLTGTAFAVPGTAVPVGRGCSTTATVHGVMRVQSP